MRSLLIIGAALLTLTVATKAHAIAFDSGTLTDDYIGAENNGFAYDVIGNSTFLVHNSRVFGSFNNALTAVIGTNFVDTPNSGGARYGDLFLSNGYAPDLSAAVPPDAALTGDWYGVNDNLFTGNRFTYVARLTGDLLSNGGGISLWKLDASVAAGTYAASVLESDLFFGVGPNHRNGQEVRVDTTYIGNTLVKASAGNWSRDTSANTLTIKVNGLENSGLLDGGRLAWRWTMTCGNDAVEDFLDIPDGGVPVVPEPTSLLVFSSLAGLGFVGGLRRRRRKI